MTAHATPIRPVYDMADPSTMILDLANMKPKDVLSIHEAIQADMRANPTFGPLPVSTGWHDITPAIALALLKRNLPGANRWLNPMPVGYYAKQMARGEWKATGQPILISVNGELKDAQHRLYAGLISGVTFKSYVITDIEDIPNLFVYIDNVVQVRGAAAALQTAGYNGVSATIAKVLRLAEEVRLGVFNRADGETKLDRLAPAQVLDLMGTYQNAQVAAQSASSDWTDAVKYLGNRKDVVAYVGMRIMDEHDEMVAEEFLDDVMDDSERAADHPITALRKLMDHNNRQKKQMPRQALAANLILAFNAWHQNGTLVRRWWWNRDTDAFPAMVQGAAQANAAE